MRGALVAAALLAIAAPGGAQDSREALGPRDAGAVAEWARRPRPLTAIMLFTLLVGVIVDRYSYTPVYIMVGMMAPLAAILFLVIMRKIERVPAVVPSA